MTVAQAPLWSLPHLLCIKLLFLRASFLLLFPFLLFAFGHLVAALTICCHPVQAATTYDVKNPQKVGYLEKQSRYLKQWKKRWVVLTKDAAILTFADEHDLSNPTEVIDVRVRFLPFLVSFVFSLISAILLYSLRFLLSC